MPPATAGPGAASQAGARCGAAAPAPARQRRAQPGLVRLPRPALVALQFFQVFQAAPDTREAATPFCGVAMPADSDTHPAGSARQLCVGTSTVETQGAALINRSRLTASRRRTPAKRGNAWR